MTGRCNGCTDPLIIAPPSDQTNGESGSSGPIIDDIELTCGHHYHWSCFFTEWNSTEPDAQTTCPHCHAVITDPTTGKLLVTFRHQGQEQQNFDIGRVFEEALRNPNPELERVSAWLSLCAEGNGDEVLQMLDQDSDLLASRDFETGQTCLHVAVQNGEVELAMLLLSRGADRDAVDFQRRTFVDLARELGESPDVIARLRSG